MPRAPKQCGQPGCPEWVTGRTYCDEHHRDRQRQNLSPTSKAANVRAERRRRAEAVKGWVNVNGWICPGWRRPPHESHDLTAAHHIAVARGGANSPLFVLCRPCNARQQTTPA